MQVRQALLLLSPFVLLGLAHYLNYANSALPTGMVGRVRAAAEKRGRDTSRTLTLHENPKATRPASGTEATQTPRTTTRAAAISHSTSSTVVKAKSWTGMKGALSSEAATMKILESAGLTAGSIEGLGEVTTAEDFVEKLPPGETVWLTFSNMAYLHFAQNWYMQVRAVGRQRQVVVAALDLPTLQTWRSLRVPVLNFTEFGDSSDFRGIGSDQARFRRMGAMKVAAFHKILLLGRCGPFSIPCLPGTTH